MEEGGHYYTVYYTSLAVGTVEATAYQHALIAQMPDEVSRMDATNMQIKEGAGTREYDFNNKLRWVPINERYGMQYGLHSLPGNQLPNQVKSSAYQRSWTTARLNQQNINSLEFGLLLHRLGDSYAHSRIGNESVMYQVTKGSSINPMNMGYGRNDYGHLADMHDPDFPFLRPNLFYSYLHNLYTVLANKLAEPANASYRRRNFTAKTFLEVKAAFSDIFARVMSKANAYDSEMLKNAQDSAYMMGGGSSYIPSASNDMKDRWFIEAVRKTAKARLDKEMRDYAPETQDAMPLRDFLNQHHSLDRMNINNDKLVNAIEDMVPGGGKGLLDVPAPVTNATPSPMFYFP